MPRSAGLRQALVSHSKLISNYILRRPRSISSRCLITCLQLRGIGPGDFALCTSPGTPAPPWNLAQAAYSRDAIWCVFCSLSWSRIYNADEAHKGSKEDTQTDPPCISRACAIQSNRTSSKAKTAHSPVEQTVCRRATTRKRNAGKRCANSRTQLWLWPVMPLRDEQAAASCSANNRIALEDGLQLTCSRSTLCMSAAINSTKKRARVQAQFAARNMIF